MVLLHLIYFMDVDLPPHQVEATLRSLVPINQLLTSQESATPLELVCESLEKGLFTEFK